MHARAARMVSAITLVSNLIHGLAKSCALDGECPAAGTVGGNQPWRTCTVSQNTCTRVVQHISYSPLNIRRLSCLMHISHPYAFQAFYYLIGLVAQHAFHARGLHQGHPTPRFDCHHHHHHGRCMQGHHQRVYAPSHMATSPNNPLARKRTS